MKVCFNILLLFLLTSPLCSQITDTEKLEEALETISDDTDVSIQLDEVEGLIQDPINLKNTDVESLMRIPGFSPALAEKILNLAKDKNIKTIRDIADKVNLTDEQYYLLKLCSYIERDKKRRRKYNFYARARNIYRASEIDGFADDKFIGDRLNLYQRFNAYYDGASAGVLIDKDEGETKLNDFTSGYLSLEYFNSKLVAGDYYLSVGMGNLFWKSFGMRKGANAIMPALQWGSGIEPYRSSIEASFFRGAALETDISLFSNNSIKLRTWYSNVDRSATVDDIGIVTSVYKTGYYRTPSEISKKNALNENLYGANLEWKSKYFSVGAVAYHIKYDKPIESISKSVFSGNQGLLGSVYSLLTFSDVSFGTEVSKDANSNIAIKAGTQLVKQDFSIAAGFRSYDALFRSPYGYNFGEQSYIANETGFYFGVNWKKYKTLNISAYLDIYRSKQQTYYIPYGLRGIDLFSEIWWKPHRKTEIRIRLRYEDKTDSHTDYDIEQKLVYQKIKPALRFDIKHNVNTKLFLRFRSESNAVLYEKDKSDEEGFMMFMELSWQIFKQLKAGGRATIYSTDSYDSAIWQYEYAMQGYMTTVPLYGKGSRYYMYLKIMPIENIILTLRSSYMKKNNTETLGSGYYETLYNEDLRFYFQLDLRF